MKFDKSMLKVYAVTDRTWTGKFSLEEQIEQALQAGITMLQLREKHKKTEELIEEGKRVKKLASHYHVPFIMNDCVQAAIACRADGVHVGQSDMEAGDVRAMIGPNMILGVTAKTVEQALKAEACGADYLGVGAVFGSSTKTDAIKITCDQLKEICNAVSIPVVAIGGITLENIRQLKGCGAAGVAVVSAVFGSEDIEEAVYRLKWEVSDILEEDE